MKHLYLLFIPLLFSCGPIGSSGGASKHLQIAEPQFGTIEVVRKLPHNAESYTQGILVHDGQFYESTGEYGRSKLRMYDVETGKVGHEIDLADRYFGEGLTLYKDKLYQLTWMEGECLVYDHLTFEQLSTIKYQGQGWGIVTHNDSLLLSDGSAEIRVVDPETFHTLRRFTVRDHNGEVDMLNEMEMIDGKLYANIYMSPIIAVIDPQTGIVEKYLDGSALIGMIGNPTGADVLNGIAHDEVTGKTYLTGKLWDTLFEVEF